MTERLKMVSAACRLTMAIVALIAAHVGAKAQTSDATLHKDPVRAYSVTKQAMEQLIAQYGHKYHLTLTEGKYKYDIDLTAACAERDHFLDTADVLRNRLADLAYLIVTWQIQLSSIGYPKELWQEPLNRFEATEIAHLPEFAKLKKRSADFEDEVWKSAELRERAFIHQIADKLNKGIRGLSLPEVYIEAGGCAGEIDVLIIAQKPPPAQIMVITLLDYLYCERAGIDPDNPKRCSWWQEVGLKKTERLAGQYRYFVKWSDGVTRQGVLRLDDKEGLEITITLERPN